MYNMLTEGYPTEYAGYLIRTDYRVGLKILRILKDYSREQSDRDTDALYELYGEGVPEDNNLAIYGLLWFLSGGEQFHYTEYMDFVNGENIDEAADSASKKGDSEVMYDFDCDSKMIWSSMWSQYGVDISEEKIHWFKFLAMFAGLKDTSINDIMHYRTMDLSEFKDQKFRDKMAKLKDMSRIRGLQMTPEQITFYKNVYGDEWKKEARSAGFVIGKNE